MKTITRSVISPGKDSTEDENRLLFTPSEVIELLLQIHELRGFDIRMGEIYRGVYQIIVGDSIYHIAEE